MSRQRIMSSDRQSGRRIRALADQRLLEFDGQFVAIGAGIDARPFVAPDVRRKGSVVLTASAEIVVHDKIRHAVRKISRDFRSHRIWRGIMSQLESRYRHAAIPAAGPERIEQLGIAPQM